MGFTTYTDLAVTVEDFPPWENQPLLLTDLSVAVEDFPHGETSLYWRDLPI